MALNDQAVITAAVGYVYTNTVGVTAPTPTEIEGFTPSAGLTGWTNIGHTSRDDLPEFGFDGGDTETRGTWQVAALKTVVTEPAVDYVTINLNQLDGEALSLYYSTANATDAVEGEFIVRESSLAAVQRALAIVIVDGDATVGFYAPKCDIRREDAMTLAVDEFAALPIRATFLSYTNTTSGETEMFRWISLDTGINAGAGV